MCIFKKIALSLSLAAGLIAPPAHAHVISDQGFVKVFALKASCVTKYGCGEADPTAAAQRALAEDPMIESDFPAKNSGRHPGAPGLLLILPGRPHKEPDLDEGPAVY